MRRWVISGGLAVGAALACSEDPAPGEGANAAGQASEDGGSAGTHSGGGEDASAGSGIELGATGGARPGGAGPGTDGGNDTGAAGEGGAGVKPLPKAGPISGLVRFGREPVAGVAVALGNEATVTNDSGEFSFTFAEESYDLVLLSTEHKVAVVVDGLTTREPDVEFDVSAPSPWRTTIAGKLTGIVAPQGNSETRIGFVSNTTGSNGSHTYGPTPSSFTLNAAWRWGREQTGTLMVLTTDYGASNRYTGYAESTFTITEGVPFGALDGSIAATHLSLAAPPAWRTVSGSVSYAEGMSGSLALMVGPFGLSVDDQDEDGYEAVVPMELSVPSTVYCLAGVEGIPNRTIVVSQSVPAEGDLDFAIEAPVGPVLPIDSAGGVTTSTNFTWSDPPSETVSYVVFEIDDWRIVSYSTATHTTLPDLAAYGVPLPPDRLGIWQVFAIGPASSVDEAVSLENPQRTPGLLNDFVFSHSEPRTFLTAE